MFAPSLDRGWSSPWGMREVFGGSQGGNVLARSGIDTQSSLGGWVYECVCIYIYEWVCMSGCVGVCVCVRVCVCVYISLACARAPEVRAHRRTRRARSPLVPHTPLYQHYLAHQQRPTNILTYAQRTQMSVVAKVNECAQKGLLVRFEVNIDVAAPDGAVLAQGSGTGNALNVANHEACAKVLPAVTEYFSLKRKRDTERRRLWISDFTNTMFRVMDYPDFAYIEGDCDLNALRDFVQDTLTLAGKHPESMQWLGMDSEGHGPPVAKYAQFCGEAGAVVVALTPPAIEILYPLFETANIGMVVVDARTEHIKLGPHFSNPGEKLTALFDLQDLAMVCMNTKFRPSQVDLTQFLLGEKGSKLKKMANLDLSLQPYAPFEHLDTLDPYLLLYAAVDALATLWAFDKFINIATESQKVACGLDGWLARRLDRA
jgi:hypothetical protein